MRSAIVQQKKLQLINFVSLSRHSLHS